MEYIHVQGLQLKCNSKIFKYFGNIYALDLTKSKTDLLTLKFEDLYWENNPDFSPHGISYWYDEATKDIYLYVISHWNWLQSDSIEVFKYNPNALSLKYIKSIRDPLLQNINNLIVMGQDEFYATRWMYFNNFLHTFEGIYRLPLTSVLYYNTAGKVTEVVTGLKGCNGINKSRNNKYIYILLHVIYYM